MCRKILMALRRAALFGRTRDGFPCARAGVLSTVVVVAVLMLLVVMAVIALWDADFLLFARANHIRVQRANIESTFTLYCNYPEADGVVVLYDSVPGSRMTVRRRPWGLYEMVVVESADGMTWRAGILGRRSAMSDDCVLWYRNNHGAVTMSGESQVEGRAFLPANGVTYGQMQATFFRGEKLAPENIRTSGEAMPEPSEEATEMVAGLFGLTGTDVMPDSLAVSFRGGGQVVVASGEAGYLSGALVVTGGRVKIERHVRLHDIIVMADHIEVEDGFRGSAQLFARDSVVVGKSVIMEPPSGIYVRKYTEIGEGSELNGYVIVDFEGEEDIMKPVCRTASGSTQRGLLYCTGVAELQGRIEGCAVLSRSVYYSSQGYYSDFLYDVAIVDNREVAYPFWLDAPPERRVAKWVH